MRGVGTTGRVNASYIEASQTENCLNNRYVKRKQRQKRKVQTKVHVCQCMCKVHTQSSYTLKKRWDGQLTVPTNSETPRIRRTNDRAIYLIPLLRYDKPRIQCTKKEFTLILLIRTMMSLLYSTLWYCCMQAAARL